MPPSDAPVQTRAEIISEFEYGGGLVAAPAPPAAAAPAVPAAPKAKATPPPPADQSDSAPYEPAPYTPDADETVVCPSCELLNDVDASYCDQCGFQLAGAADVTTADPATPPAPDDAQDAAMTAAADAATPVDADGNVDGTAKCANPDCGHMASAHLNDDTAGDNTGACQMTDCSCLGMQVDAGVQGNTGAGDKGSDVSEPDAQAAVGDAPAVPATAGTPAAAGGDLNAPPPMAGGDAVGGAFTIPVGIIEGQPTGDGRTIEPGALTWRVPPIPLMLLKTEPHGSEWDPNLPAVLCGRIDTLERVAGEGSTQVINAKGFYLATEDGQEAQQIVEGMGRCGVSGDVATIARTITVTETDESGYPTEEPDVMITEGVILGFTVCPFAAFAGAYIINGDGTDETAPVPIAQTADNTPALVAAGGQLINFMAYEDCGCDPEAMVLVASATPDRPPASWFADPGFAPGDGRMVEILDRRGGRADKYACPLAITAAGQVYGHIAPWGVCHIGDGTSCTEAPSSKSNYSYFKRGQTVLCADGSEVRVGVLTADAGHALLNIHSTEAMAHYDNIATAVADVNVGEDEYGIWVAGRIRPTATDAQVQALRASSISGDWRKLGGTLELVAALAVNVPGFPVAQVDDGAHDYALLASGAKVMAALKAEAEEDPVAGDPVLRTALAPLFDQSVALSMDRIGALR